MFPHPKQRIPMLVVLPAKIIMNTNQRILTRRTSPPKGEADPTFIPCPCITRHHAHFSAAAPPRTLLPFKGGSMIHPVVPRVRTQYSVPNTYVCRTEGGRLMRRQKEKCGVLEGGGEAYSSINYPYSSETYVLTTYSVFCTSLSPHFLFLQMRKTREITDAETTRA
jgi:hypothetical protein